MAANVAGNFSAAGGVADVDCIFEVEFFGEMCIRDRAEGVPIRISASIGATVVDPSENAEHEGLVTADAALYDAKTRGCLFYTSRCV